jgi:isoleucyl-tRNA synthetase
VLDTYGADAMRWYLFTAKQPWDGWRMSMATIEEAVRQFLLQLWNTYGFYVLYANTNEVAPASVDSVQLTDLDRWALSRLQETVAVVRERLDDFDATVSGREIQRFVDDLSNWYVRRSRPRFWDGDPAAFATLRHCLVTVSKLLAPFCPFIADEIFDNLDGSEPSVHLCDFPVADGRDEELEQTMAVARETVRLGLAARSQAKIRVRQPLRAAVIVATGRERRAIERLSDLVRDELNVRELRFVSEADELGEVEVKPNYRSLGPRFGRQMPMVAAAIAGLDPARVAATLRDGETVAIDVGGSEHALGADDLLISMKPLEGYQVEREGSHAVALELEIDGPLRAEGLARDVVHAVQQRRRDAGLQVSDRITLILDGDAELLDAVRAHQDWVAGEILALEITYADLDGAEPVMIDGRPLKIGIAVA